LQRKRLSLEKKLMSQCIGNEGWVPICPDFLRRFVALIHSMRLSLAKGAHGDPSGKAWQEIGVKPSFGLSGILDALSQVFLGVKARFSRQVISGACIAPESGRID
jgi:hypothetical protein